MDIPAKILNHQKEIDEFIKDIEPQLKNVAMKRHHSLRDISNVRFDESGVSFDAGGHCWGYFEDSFFVKWSDL